MSHTFFSNFYDQINFRFLFTGKFEKLRCRHHVDENIFWQRKIICNPGKTFTTCACGIKNKTTFYIRTQICCYWSNFTLKPEVLRPFISKNIFYFFFQLNWEKKWSQNEDKVSIIIYFRPRESSMERSCNKINQYTQ